MDLISCAEVKINFQRQRGDYGDLQELADSIKEHGQGVPVILDDSNELIDGERRLRAVRDILKLPSISYVRRSKVSEMSYRVLELEFNVRRKDMTWQEKNKAIEEIHRLKADADPTWTYEATAKAVGLKRGKVDVADAIKINKFMSAFPELAKAKNLFQAKAQANYLANSLIRRHESRSKPEEFADVESKILLGDSVELIKLVPDASFDAVITDPPFGINFDSRRSADVSVVGHYVDDAKSYRRILTMAQDLYRVIKPNGWLVWFFGMSWYEECKAAFDGAGFTVDEIPIVWDRSDGKTYTNRPDLYLPRGYDVALHCHKGSPQIMQRGKSNVLRFPPVQGDDRELIAERPVELYAEIIRRLTVEGEVVADFFVGSGSCPAAAAGLRRQYFGVELSADRREVALRKIKSHTP